MSVADRVRVMLGAACVLFGVLAVVVGGGAYGYAWYSAAAWSRTDEARRIERAADAPPPVWLDDMPAGASGSAGSAGPARDPALTVEVGSIPSRGPMPERRGSLGEAGAASSRDELGSHDDGFGSRDAAGAVTARADAAPGSASEPPIFVPPDLRHIIEAFEATGASARPGPPPRRAQVGDIDVADVDFRFLGPPEPGAHARLQLAVRNRSDAPSGPVSITIPARWFESFAVVGAVPAVLLDRTEQDGQRYFDYPGVGPAETVALELYVVATDEDMDAPPVRVVLRDEEADLARFQPRTVAPRPRPGPARQVEIPALGIRAGVVPTVWEPPEFVVGQIMDSAAVSLGNTVLIGHLSGPAGDVFNRLDRAKLGDEVVAVSRGVEFRFVISDLQVLPNNDHGPMLPTETPRLTMMTCRGTWNPFRQDYSHRLWVVAEPPELAQVTIEANRERAARAAEELARVQAEAEQAAATATAAAQATTAALAEAAANAAAMEGTANESESTSAGTPIPGSDDGSGLAAPSAAEPVQTAGPVRTDAAADSGADVSERERSASVTAARGGAPTRTATPAATGPGTGGPPASSGAPAPSAPVARLPAALQPARPDTRATAQAPRVAASPTPLSLPDPPLVAIREPAAGAEVPQRVTLRGELVGERPPDGHLWLAVRAEVEGSRWYVFGQEIRPDRDGRWELELELGGSPNIRHEVRIGSADEPAHAALARHARERTGDPFDQLPEGFETQATVTLVRR